MARKAGTRSIPSGRLWAYRWSWCPCSIPAKECFAVLTSYYLPQTRNLLQLPGTNSTSLYTDANLTLWINIARGQVAGEGECIRVMGTINTVTGQAPYAFSGVNTGVS